MENPLNCPRCQQVWWTARIVPVLADMHYIELQCAHCQYGMHFEIVLQESAGAK
jgi:hypothetical protein